MNDVQYRAHGTTFDGAEIDEPFLTQDEAEEYALSLNGGDVNGPITVSAQPA